MKTTSPQSIAQVAFVGLPNVGKSSLVNRLLGRRQAIVHSEEHTTRDTAAHRVEIAGHRFLIQDTPGFARRGDRLHTPAMQQLDRALLTADAVVMVVNAAAPIHDDERELTKRLHKLGKPVLLIANQIDKAGADPTPYERLGLGEALPVSAQHGTGVDALTGWLTTIQPSQTTSHDRPALNLAIIGHPNAGKSSLLNALTDSTTAVVSDLPGTTRDPIDAEITVGDHTWRFIDTAGLRRPGKIERNIEFFSLKRTQQVIAEADICILVVDAQDAGNAQDQRIAGLVQEAGRGLVIVMNKVDLLSEEALQFAWRDLENAMEFVRWAPMIELSTVTGENLDALTSTLSKIAKYLREPLPTKEVNQVLQELIHAKPPASSTRFRPKLNYAVQTALLPCTITVFGAHPEAIHFSYRRYLENGFRKKWPFVGIPIKIVIKSKHKD